MGDGIVNIRSVLVLMMTLMLFTTGASAAPPVGGENSDPVVEETIFSAIYHAVKTSDGDDWWFEGTLNDDAAANNTTFTLTVQQCNNDGVCFPPENVATSSSDDLTFDASIATIDDHSYVNWRITATYNDDDGATEKFPESGFYKSWSDCWFHDGSWGGEGCDGGGEDEDGLPALGIVATASAVLIAAIIRRQ